MIGLQCVGMAVATQYNKLIPLPPYLIQRAAEFQNVFGEYFTTLVVLPHQGQFSTDAYQVTDAAVRMSKEGYFRQTDDPSVISFTEELFCCGVMRKELRDDDVKILLSDVRVHQRRSKIPIHEFLSPAADPTIHDLAAYLQKHELEPSWYKFFDFNLLVFLAAKCGIKVDGDLRILIDCILAKRDVPESIALMIERRAETRQ
jgi:hypothetical protein